MSYLSLDVSQKITMSDVKGYSKHVFRKTKGVTNHSNQEIDVSRTDMNIDFRIGSERDGFKYFDERFEQRFADYNSTTKTGKQRKLRKDAVVVRGLVLQPSADVFEGMSDSEKLEKMRAFAKTSLAFLYTDKAFGFDNVVGASVHMDETNPHMHVAIMPMTQDGRLSQKDFFKGPQHLQQLHKDYREYMNANGWSFETENKYEDAKRFSEAEYKRNAPAIEVARKEHTEKKRQLSTDSNLRDEVKKELLLDEVLRNEAKQELRDELEPVVKSSIRRSVEDEYKTIKDDLNAREEQIQASESDFYDKQRIIRERFELEQEVERQKIEFEKERLRRKENELVERESALDALKRSIEAGKRALEERFEQIGSNIMRTFPGALGMKLRNSVRGNETVLTDLDKFRVGIEVETRRKEIEDGLEL